MLLHGAAGFSRLLENSLNFFSKRAPGEIFSRFTSWQMAAGQKIELDNGLRTDWVIGAIALAVMCYLSPMLALVPVVGVLLMGAVSVWAIYRDRHYTQQLQVRGAVQNDFILETIQGFRPSNLPAWPASGRKGSPNMPARCSIACSSKRSMSR